MKLVLSLLSLWMCAVLYAAPAAKPKIVVLATGGTIAGVGAEATHGQYKPGTLEVDKMLDSVPRLKELADLKGEQFCQIASQDMTTAIWLRLARRINQILAGDAAGVVITHGTDTMEETAYFLNLVISSRKPVVLTGAMRASTSLSSDGGLNLYNAVAAAAAPQSKGKGVLLVFNDFIHGARAVTKTDTTNVATFKSPHFGALGYVYYGKVRYYRESTRKHTYRSVFRVDHLDKLPRVDILYGHADTSDIYVKAAQRAGVQGIVYAGVGNGNAHARTLAALITAAQHKIMIVRSSRVGSNRVTLEAEVDDKKYGFVVADNLSPQKSRILLMLALTRTQDPAALQEYFFNY